ncbi:acyl-CoA dehydrogenase family protein [Egicoccus sp. AB-alg2]|uniref:acyl-CoA dehydrogenase family protein n=1 Tax=Egicoccus sp. AB-alg2 TaxID=3242693 RepID=UPI00359E7046
MSHLDHARTLVSALQDAVDTAAASLAARSEKDGRISTGLLDQHQTVAYDLASLASAVAAARHLLTYGEQGEQEAALALAYAADVAADLQARVAGRAAHWGLDVDVLGEAAEALAAGRDPGFLDDLAERVLATGEAGPRHLAEELEMVRQTFRRFAEDKVVPVAEEVHRHDQDIPEEVIAGLAELGCFALSIPEAYGGFSAGGEDELLNMVLVTEELSRGSLGVAGSLITRPEIIGTAILKGGTEQQKATWLPAIASGEKMCGVAVTEPDHGSDVAGVKVTATRDGDDWVINGVKTWCTFGGRAEYLLVLARTDPDRSLGHRGLSLFVVEKPAFAGHEWRAEQDGDGGGSMDARAIPTLGYRGMHSFEISFDGWRVPHANLIGEDDGLGRGFYLQMQAFANARLQTAARALGVMQSALEHATGYAKERHVFDTPLAAYELNRIKLARMAAVIAACRVFATDVARQLARGDEGAQLAASQVKQLSCRVAEWVTREAQQIHGGYGYAEEYTVSRLFVDARVLSIFEGADEVLALRVIARTLLGEALAG